MSVFLEVCFDYSLRPAEFDEQNGPAVASMVAEVPGLEWKLWLHDEPNRHCVGVYRFVDAEHAQRYVGGNIAMFRQAPGYSNIEPRLYEVIAENTRITRGGPLLAEVSIP